MQSDIFIVHIHFLIFYCFIFLVYSIDFSIKLPDFETARASVQNFLLNDNRYIDIFIIVAFNTNIFTSLKWQKMYTFARPSKIFAYLRVKPASLEHYRFDITMIFRFNEDHLEF